MYGEIEPGVEPVYEVDRFFALLEEEERRKEVETRRWHLE